MTHEPRAPRDTDTEPDGAGGLREDLARGRELDRELARALGRPVPGAAATGDDWLAPLSRGVPSPERQRSLVAAARTGDPAARAELVAGFLPLVAAQARTYPSEAVSRTELLQEGVVGLLRALDRFDPERGVPFWGYAVFWVRQAMQGLVSELLRPVVLSDRALRQLARLRDARDDAVRHAGREPGRRELAERSGLSVDQVDGLLATDRRPRSVDEPLTGDEGVVGTFGDGLADVTAGDEYERVLDALAARDVVGLLAGLSAREREVLRARFGLDGEEQSLRQVGGRMGLSAERVRQIEGRALAKLAAAAGA